MDRFIASLPFEDDGDLALCRDHGVAYQKDMANLVVCDDEYYSSAADSAQENEVNDGRMALVTKHFGSLSKICDIGIGSGEFIKRRGNTYGFDVNPVAIEWLKRNDLWANDISMFGAYTLWDVIGHLSEPETYFKRFNLHSKVFASLPILYGLGGIRASMHYRPGERLYYWTEDGFVQWMAKHGFMLLDSADFEIQAGRESMYSFVFKRVAWPSSKSN